jgi:hypothetical protein
MLVLQLLLTQSVGIATALLFSRNSYGEIKDGDANEADDNNGRQRQTDDDNIQWMSILTMVTTRHRYRGQEDGKRNRDEIDR